MGPDHRQRRLAPAPAAVGHEARGEGVGAERGGLGDPGVRGAVEGVAGGEGGRGGVGGEEEEEGEEEGGEEEEEEGEEGRRGVSCAGHCGGWG